MQQLPTGGKHQQLSLLDAAPKEPEPIKLQDYSKNQHKELKAKLTTLLGKPAKEKAGAASALAVVVFKGISICSQLMNKNSTFAIF